MASGDSREREVQQAINRALAAEREATAAVERARDEAEALLSRSREEARRLRQRGEQRAAALHERYGCAREKRVDREHAAATVDPPAPDPREEKARIARAVQRVAARLTGVEP